MSLCGSLTYNTHVHKPNYWVGCYCFLLFFFGFFLSVQSQTHPVVPHSQEPAYLIQSIDISGNKRTKEKIILRELNFKPGDKILLADWESYKTRSQQNLINTSLFNFVTITETRDDSLLSLIVHIQVKERWYTWPNPVLEVQDRNFNAWWTTKDLFRINYGVYLTFENVRGRNESLTFKLRKGYTEQYGVSYKIPFINPQQTLGLSLAYNFFRNNEIAYSTYGNQLKFYRNYTSYVREEQEAKININYRKSLYLKHFFELSYKIVEVSDIIQQLNPSYFIPENCSLSYLSFQYSLRLDLRDVKIYPLKGYCYEAAVLKEGFNLLKNETTDNLLMSLSFRNYWNILPRTYLATQTKLRYSFNTTPVYYFNRALGFNDFVRGYEYYVIDGQTYFMNKVNIRFQLIKPRVLHIPVKRFDKFKHIPYAVYLGTYSDWAFVQDKFYYADNPLTNSWLMGFGVGLDVVTYYDNVIRIEASMNKMQQKGIFLHLTAPF